MKQLISKSSCRKHIAVGLDTLALVALNAGDESNDKQQQLIELKSSFAGDDIPSVLSVAVFQIQLDGKSQLHCAVSRDDKTLEMYAIEIGALADRFVDQNSPVSIGPIQTFQTSKRVSSIAYTRITNNETGKHDELKHWCWICADHAGDAIAYPLPELGSSEESSKVCRVLLGHTASILTKMKIVKNKSSIKYLLTSDRDEKVRVSLFPQTHVVKGYLLGHTEFISCMDAIDASYSKSHSCLCVSGSGDGTIRLWNYEYCKKLDQIEPVKENENEVVAISDVAFNEEGSQVAVVRNGSSLLEIYDIEQDTFVLKLSQKIDCGSILLSCIFSSDGTLYVLSKEPQYVITLRRTERIFTQTESNLQQGIARIASEKRIAITDSVLDTRDSYQNPFEKFKEYTAERERPKGTSASERKQLAKEASARRKKRKATQ